MSNSTPESAEKRLDDFADACRASGDRSRFVIILLSISTVLVFSVLWNSRATSWLALRAERARDALTVVDSVTTSAESSIALTPNRLRRAEVWLESRYRIQEGALSAHSSASDSSDVGLSQFQFIADTYRADLAQHASMLEDLLHSRVVSIEIPFIGIAFDVNDLGVLGGVAFLVVLTWLRFSLSREHENLSIIFEEARKLDSKSKSPGYLRGIYDKLVVRQVLISPKLERYENERAWDVIPYFLIGMPSLLHLAVVWHDTRTEEIGRVLDANSTSVAMRLSYVFTALIIVLTLQCVGKQRKMNALWELVFDAVRSPQEPQRKALKEL